MIGDKFSVGMRVRRLSNVFDENSPMLHGRIINCYSKTVLLDGHYREYNELYEVIWDETHCIKSGLLPHGLTKDI